MENNQEILNVEDFEIKNPIEHINDEKDENIFDSILMVDGVIPEEEYARLKQLGFSKKTVDSVVRSLESDKKAKRAKIFENIGGEEKFNTIYKFFADKNDDSIKAIDEALISTSEVLRGFIFNQMLSKYEGIVGTTGKRISASIGGDSGIAKPFKTRAEYKTAMADNRYGRDTAYTQKVLNSLKVSNRNSW